MSVVIRISEDAEEYIGNASNPGETTVETVDRLLGVNGESLEEKMRRIAEEVVEQEKRGY